MFAESLTLIDVLKSSDSSTATTSRTFDAQSSHVEKKMKRLENEYERAYSELIHAENTARSSSIRTDERYPSETSLVDGSEFRTTVKSSLSSAPPPPPIRPPEATFHSQGKSLRGFDWGTMRTNDVLRPSLVQKYWNSTSRAEGTWLDFTTWIPHFAKDVLR